MAEPLPRELKDLAETVEVHRNRLAGLIQHRGVGDLRPLYEELAGDIRRRIGALELVGRGQTMTATQLHGMMAQVEEGLAGFAGGFAQHMADVGAESQLFAVEETLDELKALAPGFRRAAIALPVEEIAVFRGLVPDVERSLLRRYRLQSANYAIETIGAVETELARGLALGRTLQENMDAIQPLIQGTEYQAERIVRTEMLEAHTRTSQEAMKEIAKDVPALRQQWYTAGTARVCDLCDGLHGKVREFGKPFGKKRERGKFVEIMKPPAHPNCMCVVTPWHAEWTREEAEAVAEEVPARAGD